MVVSNALELGGTLAVSLTNGFVGAVTNGASFTVLTAGVPVTGTFANVANGGTLLTTDGFAQFTVQYDGSSVVLNDLHLVDSVGDGIPDGWREQYFGGNGTTTNSQSCATCDADGTGQNNLFKYVAGLDPTNPTSVFVLSLASVPNQPQAMNLTFYPLALGRTYNPQFSTDLVRGVWTPLTTHTGPVTNSGNRVTITDTNPIPPQEFYRIDISLP